MLTLHDAIDFIYYHRRAGCARAALAGALRVSLDHWVARTRAERVITVSEHAPG